MATATAAVTIAAYAFSNFETIHSADGFRTLIFQRLDRIDHKLDDIAKEVRRR